MTGDESPSRMRTRNKPAKESNNKRPKRGSDAPDASATNENAKTPNKTDRRKSSKETSTKGKKRTNIDLDADNDGSDEKEKRKRTDSPTESLNSDSRPGSVLDDQENTNEPLDTPMIDADRKETDPAKVALDTASSNDESNANATPSKDDKMNATSTSTADKPESNTIGKSKELSTEKPRTISSDDSSHSMDDKSNETAVSATAAATSTAPTKAISDPSAPISKANNSTVTATTVTNTITNTISSTIQTISSPSTIVTTATATGATIVSVASAGDLKPIKPIETKVEPKQTVDASFAPKEQEIISTVANIKKESSGPVDLDNSNECAGKKMSMVIKKEPNDESADAASKDNSSNTNVNSILSSGKDAIVEPSAEIKMAHDIKTESKCGLDLTDINSKHEDGSRSAFEPHIKFSAIGKLPPQDQSAHMKFNLEPPKPMPEQLKFGPDALHAAKYPPMAADLSQKYEPKLFPDHANKHSENDAKDKANSDGKCIFSLKNVFN